MTPEQEARNEIDQLLAKVGWDVCNPDRANIHAARGVAVREFPLASGHGFADYLLYVDGKAAGVIEAKKQGVTLTGVETQSDKYTRGLPRGLPAWHNPLPFSYQSTGAETRFTNGLDPQPRSRPVFAFHRPETLAGWLQDCTPALSTGSPRPRGEGQGEGGLTMLKAAEAAPDYRDRGTTFLARLQHMPALEEAGLWPAQTKAIHNLEQSLKENRPRALIQMATGSGKTFTAISFIYRFIKSKIAEAGYSVQIQERDTRKKRWEQLDDDFSYDPTISPGAKLGALQRAAKRRAPGMVRVKQLDHLSLNGTDILAAFTER